MTDYGKAASELKSRLEAKAKREAELNAFIEAVRTSLFTEVEKANSALTYEGDPLIEFKQGGPDGPTIVLTCGAATAKISLLAPADPKVPRDPKAADDPSIVANIVSESGEKTVTYFILQRESPLRARRISLSPDEEQKIEPAEIASTIVEELINSAP